LSPLSSQLVKGCHAYGEGIDIHGADLVEYFDVGGTAGVGAPGGFVDLSGNVFADDIVWLASSGITSGCNPPANDLFCPDDLVTRGQMAAFLVRALDLPPGPDSFADDGGSVFESDIDSLAHAGIAMGCGPDSYCPANPVTRAQMATFLVNAYRLGSGPDGFVDDGESVHESDIDSLAATGVARGCNPPANDRYCPDDPVTRGQMAAFLHRADRL
jgi:hypothetical protein